MTAHEPQKDSQRQNIQGSVKTINMWAIASELGFIIALPLVILMLLAVKMDQKFDTAPLFMIMAIIVSPIISGIAVWRKIKDIHQIS